MRDARAPNSERYFDESPTSEISRALPQHLCREGTDRRESSFQGWRKENEWAHQQDLCPLERRKLRPIDYR